MQDAIVDVLGAVEGTLSVRPDYEQGRSHCDEDLSVEDDDGNFDHEVRGLNGADECRG